MAPKKKVIMPRRKSVGKDDFGGRLATDVARERGRCFRSAKVEPSLPFIFPVFEDFNAKEEIDASGIDKVCTLGLDDGLYYSSLMVREFYANLVVIQNGVFLKSRVGGTPIEFNSTVLNELFGWEDDGDKARSAKEILGDIESRNIFLENVIRYRKENAGRFISHYQISEFLPKYRLLGLMFTEYLSSKSGHWNDLEADCLDFVIHCYEGKYLNLGDLIMTHMRNVNLNSASLPHALIVCKICESVGVKVDLFPREQLSGYFNLLVKKRRAILTLGEEEATGTYPGRVSTWYTETRSDKFHCLFDTLHERFKNIPYAVVGMERTTKKRKGITMEEGTSNAHGGGQFSGVTASGISDEQFQTLLRENQLLRSDFTTFKQDVFSRFDVMKTRIDNSDRAADLHHNEQMTVNRQILETLRSLQLGGFGQVGPGMGPGYNGYPAGGAGPGSYVSFLHTGVSPSAGGAGPYQMPPYMQAQAQYQQFFPSAQPQRQRDPSSKE